MGLDTGLGGTFTDGTFSSNIISISASEQTLEALDSSHLGTATYMTKVRSDLIDPGTIDVEFFYDPNIAQPVIGAAVSTFLITYPTTGGSGATLTGTGFWTSVSSGEVAVGALMRGSGTFVYDGGTGPTWTIEA